MFALLDAALLERLPYPEPDELVQIWATDQQLGIVKGSLSLEEYRRIENRARSVRELAYSSRWNPTLGTQDGEQQILVARASSNLFETLGIAPRLGRGLPDQALPHLVLSHRLHTEQFGKTDELPEVPVLLDGTPYTIVGVMPPGFSYPSEVQAWVPTGMRPTTPHPTRDGTVLARLRPAARIEDLETELGEIARSLSETDPHWTPERGLRAVTLLDQETAPFKSLVLLLFGAVSLFFLVACSTAAQLLFLENLGRRRDFAVRSALGAGRKRLLGQLVLEASLVAGVATVGGAILTALLLKTGRHFIPPGLTRLESIELDQSVVVSMIVLGAGAALMTSFFSGWRLTRGEIATELVGGTAWRPSSLFSSRAMITALATAGILFLTAGAVALIFEMRKVTQADLGFASERVYTAQVCAPSSRPDSSTADLATAYQHVERVLPEFVTVRNVSIADDLPIGSHTTSETLIEGVEGYPEVRVRAVSSTYFETLRIPLLEGRPFSPASGSREQVVVVNQAFRDRFFPDRSPVGERFMGAWGSGPEWVTIGGVVGNLRRSAADDGKAAEVFIPFFDFERDCGVLFIATEDDGSIQPLQRQLEEVKGSLGTANLSPLQDRLAEQNWRPRLRAAALGLFGALALIFGAVALYATLSQAVASRRRELAVRAAVGASHRQLASTVLAAHLIPIGVGIVLGALACFVAMRLISTEYHGIETVDGWVLGSVCSLLALAGLAAIAGPAIRSGRMDVRAALQED